MGRNTREYDIHYVNTHIEQRLRTISKYRAKKKGLPFNISIEDIKIPKRCPVLGIKLERGISSGLYCSPSVDRINPKKGYIKGNIQIISQQANKMKSNATKAQLRRFAKWIDKFINNK